MNKNIFLSIIVGILIPFTLLTSCDGRRDFPQLVETSVAISNSEVFLTPGDTVLLKPTFNPGNILPARKYTWQIADSSLVNFKVLPDYSILLSAKGTGDTDISIVSDDKDALTAQAHLIVKSTPPVDITSNGVLSVNKENGGGPDANEGSKKLVDGNINTKYLANFSTPFYMTLTFQQPQVVNIYKMTSGNDSPSRDPKDWTISGSNDGANWTVLDQRTGEVFEGRNMTKQYTFSNQTGYLYYRLSVLANNGDGLFQMSEWRLFAFE